MRFFPRSCMLLVLLLHLILCSSSSFLSPANNTKCLSTLSSLNGEQTLFEFSLPISWVLLCHRVSPLHNSFFASPMPEQFSFAYWVQSPILHIIFYSIFLQSFHSIHSCEWTTMSAADTMETKEKQIPRWKMENEKASEIERLCGTLRIDKVISIYNTHLHNLFLRCIWSILHFLIVLFSLLHSLPPCFLRSIIVFLLIFGAIAVYFYSKY